MNEQEQMGGNALGDYRLLHELAYDVQPSTGQLKKFQLRDRESQHTSLHLLATTVEDNVILQLQCLGMGTPEWMMAGAPDPLTFDRWLTAGLLNGQTGF
jgi:hypothetical protein